MVNSIGSSGMQGIPQDFFKKVDSDGSGGVSQAELKTLAEDIQKNSGKTISVDDKSFAGYDTDGNGTLSAEELKGVLDSSGFGPNHGVQDGMAPPPPPQQAANSYDANASNSEQDTLASLIDNLKTLLEKLSSGSGNTDSNTSETSSLQQNQRPDPQDFFKKVDTDGSGGISKDELKVLADNMQKMTGQTLDASEEAFASYDSNGDGSLSADELKAAMEKNGFAPPGPPLGGMRTESASGGQAAQTTAVSGKDQITELRDLLNTLSKYSESDNSTSDSLLSVTT